MTLAPPPKEPTILHISAKEMSTGGIDDSSRTIEESHSHTTVEAASTQGIQDKSNDQADKSDETYWTGQVDFQESCERSTLEPEWIERMEKEKEKVEGVKKYVNEAEREDEECGECEKYEEV